MKAFRFYLFFLIFLVIASCKPEELPPINNGEPVFSMSGGSIGITAGEEDFYLFSDYQKDDQDVYSFIARFAKLSDCGMDCKEELLIEIRNAQVTVGSESVDIENALKPENYFYRVPDTLISNEQTILNLTSHPDGTGPFFYHWEIADTSGNIDTFSTPNLKLNLANYANTPTLDVCLEIISNNNCQIDYCNTIFLSPNTPKCQANFGVSSPPNPVEVELQAIMFNGTAPYTFQWNVDSIGEFLTVPITLPFNETFCVTITDTFGCTDEICKELNITQSLNASICGSRFSYEKTIEPGGSDSLQFSTVLIQYTDNDGVIYKSDFQQQPNSSNFKIIAVEDFENNEMGDKTKKLTISGDCLLYNEVGSMSIIFPFEGIIAVAYP